MTIYEDLTKLYFSTKREINKIDNEIFVLTARRGSLESKLMDMEIILTNHGSHNYEGFKAADTETKESQE